MLFNSLDYLLFFPVVAAIHYMLPRAWRCIWLLAASAFFYFSFMPIFFIPLVSVIIIEYFMGILIAKNKLGNFRRSRIYLMIGILFPVITLIFFKYSSLFDGVALLIARFLHLQYPPHILQLLLPIGMSYYTLQSVSYAVDVDRGTLMPERHFGMFALYLIFFPKIISGPIERPGDMLSQFHSRQEPDYTKVSAGVRLIIMGFFKKLVIADRIGIAVNDVYNNIGFYHGIYFILATILFSFQIYCDFSGYTDIARGSARVLGFRLTENFSNPYGSRSLSEFWKRWHISFTSWLKDYIYIPMGGSRTGAVKRFRNIFVTFLISGAWHGQNATFIAWGVLHALIMMIGIRTGAFRSSLVRMIRLDRLPTLRIMMQISCTVALISFAWIFFRAASISDALYIIRKMFWGCGDIIRSIVTLDTVHLKSLMDIARGNTILGYSRDTYRPEMLIMIISTIGLLLFPVIEKRVTRMEISERKLKFSQCLLYYIMAAGILFFGMFTKEQFIYFRF